MRTLIKNTLGSAVAASLVFGVSACDRSQEQGQADAKPEIAQAVVLDERAYFEELMTAPYGSAAAADAEPVDFAAAFVDLPEGTSLQTGTVTLDPATGATRVEDFAIVYDLNGTGVGLQAEEALFYGFDPNAIADRIKGTNTTASVKVADRIELRNVKSVGMEAVSELFLEEYTDALDEFTPLDDGVVDEVGALAVLNYNFEMEKLLVDGFVLEPFIYAGLETEPLSEEITEIEELMVEVKRDETEGLQMLGAFARAFSLDALAYQGVSITYEMSDEEMAMSMDMSLGLAGLRDYKRGDLDYSASWDGVFSGTFPIPDETSDDFAMKTLPMSGEIKYSAVSGMKLANAFEALSNWEMPAAEEADFFDFGIWEITNYTFDMAGKSLFNADRISFDTDFHWLLPTKINLNLANTGYNVGNLFEVMTEEMGEELDADLTPEDLRKGLQIVEQYGFDCFCGDYNLDLTWNEQTGAIQYRENGKFADAFKGTTSADIGFSTPGRVAGLIEEEDGESLFEEAFKEDFEFRSLEIVMSDTGGLTNLFDMLHAIGQAFPEQEGMAMLAYNDATQLRGLAVNSVIGMKPMVRQEVPGADPWMDALASFLEEGGTLTIAAKPPRPINAALIDEMDDKYAEDDPEPEEIAEIFGFSVTHTK